MLKLTKLQQFPNLKCRSITINDFINDNIGFLIGDKGKNFFHITSKFNLLYVWYSDNKIVLFGENDNDLMDAVRSLIKKIKYMNWKKYNSDPNQQFTFKYNNN